MKQILFFATTDDLASVLTEAERLGPLRYLQTGLFERSDNEALNGWRELPNLGIATAESAISSQSFLVAETTTRISKREVTVASGARKTAIDQLVNPDTVILTPGGRWAHDVLLHGRVATASESQGSQALMKRFRDATRKAKFAKIKAFVVGPKAQQLFESGMRLTLSARAPAELDLRRE